MPGPKLPHHALGARPRPTSSALRGEDPIQPRRRLVDIREHARDDTLRSGVVLAGEVRSAGDGIATACVRGVGWLRLATSRLGGTRRTLGGVVGVEDQIARATRQWKRQQR